MSEALPRPENKLHYPALDGLRAIAVGMVFMQHYDEGLIPGLSHWGWVGVEIFFVLSGFLITGILFDTRNTTHKFRNFYMRRTLRIFPLYYAVLGFCAVVGYIKHCQLVPVLPIFATYVGNFGRFFYLDSPLYHAGAVEHIVRLTAPGEGPVLLIGHFWSLCVEEQFYLLWPFVVYTVRDRVKLRNICIAAVVIVPVLRVIAAHVLPAKMIEADILLRATPLRMDALLLGGLVALCLRGPEADFVRRWAKPGLKAFFAATAASLLAFYVVKHRTFVPEQHPFIAQTGLAVLDLAAAMLVLRVIDKDSALFKPLTWPVLRWLGTISYGLYVFHDLFHVYWRRLASMMVGDGHATVYVTAAIAMVGTVVIAAASFYLFESPFLRLKKYFVPR